MACFCITTPRAAHPPISQGQLIQWTSSSAGPSSPGRWLRSPAKSVFYVDLDERVGVDEPWGVDLARVATIQAAASRLNPTGRNR